MQNKSIQAVIPCAGLGTRFLPVTKIVPKELLAVGNRPAIQYVVEEAVAAGVEEIVLVCHRSKWEIVDYFRRDSDLASTLESRGKLNELKELERVERLASFRVVYQEEPLGLGHAVWTAREAIRTDPFLVLLPDELVFPCEEGAPRLVHHCKEQSAWGLLLEEVPREKVSSYGIVNVSRGENGIYHIQGAVEKPAPDQIASPLAITGRYLLPRAIFDLLGGSPKKAAGEIQLTDAIDSLAAREPGIGLICQGRRMDIGTPEGLARASSFVTA